MKIHSFALTAILASNSVAAQSPVSQTPNRFFHYDMDLTWSTSAVDQEACLVGDRANIDHAIFDNLNMVLISNSYSPFKKITEERAQERRGLRVERQLCNGTKLCARACAYNVKLCNMIYKCGCRRLQGAEETPEFMRALQGETAPSREDLESQMNKACDAAIFNMELSTAISSTCKDALFGVTCSLNLSDEVPDDPVEEAIAGVEQDHLFKKNVPLPPQKFPYLLDMAWSSPSAEAMSCPSENKEAVDEAIFDSVNTVLTKRGYKPFRKIWEESRRRALHVERQLCNGTFMCARACRYNKKLCNIIYKCGCKRRLEGDEEIPEFLRHLNQDDPIREEIEEEISAACNDAVAQMSVDSGIEKSCQDALATSSCEVSVTVEDVISQFDLQEAENKRASVYEGLTPTEIVELQAEEKKRQEEEAKATEMAEKKALKLQEEEESSSEEEESSSEEEESSSEEEEDRKADEKAAKEAAKEEEEARKAEEKAAEEAAKEEEKAAKEAAKAAKDLPYVLELTWVNDSADEVVCTPKESAIVDQAIFDETNKVLKKNNFLPFKMLKEEKGDRRLRAERHLCNGTKLCARACSYNKKLCNMIYKCGCRRRLDTTPAVARELEEGPARWELQEDIHKACLDALKDTHKKVDSEACEEAVEEARCIVALS